MPFAGAKVLHDLSTVSASLLANQHRKYNLDWEATHAAFPEILQETYRYNWCLVNTRTFYYVRPGTQTPKVHDDCMALVPFADFFNHADKGCIVEFNHKGFTIYADKTYEKGEELYISYGSHSNDFLLVEYGFTLKENVYNSK